MDLQALNFNSHRMLTCFAHQWSRFTQSQEGASAPLLHCQNKQSIWVGMDSHNNPKLKVSCSKSLELATNQSLAAHMTHIKK